MKKYFLAPPWFVPDGNFRTVGFSSTANSPSIPGCCYLWGAGTPVQIESPTTPAEWPRMTVAVIPDGQTAADGIYAHICLYDHENPFRVTPTTVTLLADDGSSPAEWDRMVLAVIDAAFWATYGSTYVAPGNGMYFDENYRATVIVPNGREGLVPVTWDEIDQAAAQARHPGMEV